MKPLTGFDALIQVQPWDDLYLLNEEGPAILIQDREPFRFRVAEHLFESEGVIYGLSGPVVAGHRRYSGLTCSAVIRSDGPTWTSAAIADAAFKVGRTKIFRNPKLEYSHPDGTLLQGYPQISSIGEISVVEPENMEAT